MKDLVRIAAETRCEVIEMINRAGSGHPGGSLSATDIMVYLFFKEMDQAKDRFILSKGHAAPVFYSILSRQGKIPKGELQKLRTFGSICQGHPDTMFLPLVTVSSGSLGQGLSVANGLAIALRSDGSGGRVYVIVGDGEIQEGQIWEAAMTAPRYKLDNVCLIVDYNGIQLDGFVKDIKPLEPLVAKWKAFGWNAIPADGHDFKSLRSAFNKAKNKKGMPSVIIAKTVKGKGVSFMENACDFHGKAPDKDQTTCALGEIRGCLE